MIERNKYLHRVDERKKVRGERREESGEKTGLDEKERKMCKREDADVRCARSTEHRMYANFQFKLKKKTYFCNFFR